MKAAKLSGLVILVSLQLTFSQELQDLLQEGSGSVGESVTPSLVDDYVNCPPDAGDNDDASLDESLTAEDYAYDYDAPLSMPSIAFDDLVDTVENATVVELVNDDLQEEPSAEADGEELSTAEVIDFGEDSEEASGDEDDVSSSIQLIEAPKIYNVPDTESLDNKFAAFTEEHPEEIVLTSPNYPEPYPNVVNSFENYTVTGGIGVQITIHDIDLDHNSDFLFIRGGSVTDNDENGPVLTGKISSPVRFLIPHTTTFSVHFVSQHDESEVQSHKGFRLTYAPFGTVVSLTTPTTTEMIVPREELQWVRKEVMISRDMMVSVETWPQVKMALANASNAFVQLHQLKYQLCRPDDIRILAQKCPDTWPGYEECVSLEFAIPLRPIVVIEEEVEGSHGLDGKSRMVAGKGFIPLTTTEEPEVEYQLAKDNLERMWMEFGAMALADVGIEVYKMPENASVLLIWIAISLCILAAFIFVLYSIWKIDFFKDYRRISKLSREPRDDDRSELKKKEYDISMFPSPHQVVPTLFPTGDPYSERSAEAQYAYDNSTMNPWADEMDEPEKFNGNPSTPRNLQQPKQQVFEPLSPMDYSPSIVDFNEIPESRSPRRSRGNPFLPPSNGGSPGGRGGGQ